MSAAILANVVKQCHKPSPSHYYRFCRCCVYHSQSWVVNMALFQPQSHPIPYFQQPLFMVPIRWKFPTKPRFLRWCLMLGGWDYSPLPCPEIDSVTPLTSTEMMRKLMLAPALPTSGMGLPQWLDGFSMEDPNTKWMMTGGYPYFRKPPYSLSQFNCEIYSSSMINFWGQRAKRIVKTQTCILEVQRSNADITQSIPQDLSSPQGQQWSPTSDLQLPISLVFKGSM